MSRVSLRSGLVLLALTAGCQDIRRSWTTRELLVARSDHEAVEGREALSLIAGAVAHVKNEHDEWRAGRRATPPSFDILILSGGGDWGAFGAGFLRGWGRVEGPLARPRFTIVSGVSTGALLAPFAFFGDDESFAFIERLYRNPREDWVEPRQPVWFLPTNASFATVRGLERELKSAMNLERIARIAREGATGRALVMSTTNLDDGTINVWDIVDEAQRTAASRDPGRVHRIMLASSGIPGAFPYRMIDGAMHVDGGVTGNILYGGRLGEKQTHVAVWKSAYPDIPVPTTRYWVIFNNQLRGPPRTVDPSWPDIVTRSIDIAIRSSTVTAIRHLLAQGEIMRRVYGVDVEVRIVAIPDDWTPVEPGVFRAATMNALADLGRRMGEDPESWRTEIPR